MSPGQNVSPAEPRPFSFYLQQAEKSAGDHTRVYTPSQGILRTLVDGLRAAARWLQRAHAAKTAHRRLRVTETVSLGEKRFLSIVQVDGAQFLIGSSATNVQLLAQLDSQSREGPRPQAATQESA